MNTILSIIGCVIGGILLLSGGTYITTICNKKEEKVKHNILQLVCSIFLLVCGMAIIAYSSIKFQETITPNQTSQGISQASRCDCSCCTYIEP